MNAKEIRESGLKHEISEWDRILYGALGKINDLESKACFDLIKRNGYPNATHENINSICKQMKDNADYIEITNHHMRIGDVFLIDTITFRNLIDINIHDCIPIYMDLPKGKKQ